MPFKLLFAVLCLTAVVAFSQAATAQTASDEPGTGGPSAKADPPGEPGIRGSSDPDDSAAEPGIRGSSDPDDPVAEPGIRGSSDPDDPVAEPGIRGSSDLDDPGLRGASGQEGGPEVFRPKRLGF
ncbi:MAG: hypothetical protein LBQ79_10235 [Deltaproteobacteria bacterium]|jgi:hypothetical protein|nr:hypothetical protein [Deltaproteobacteria bacterium]